MFSEDQKNKALDELTKKLNVLITLFSVDDGTEIISPIYQKSVKNEVWSIAQLVIMRNLIEFFYDKPTDDKITAEELITNWRDICGDISKNPDVKKIKDSISNVILHPYIFSPLQINYEEYVALLKKVTETIKIKTQLFFSNINDIYCTENMKKMKTYLDTLQ